YRHTSCGPPYGLPTSCTSRSRRSCCATRDRPAAARWTVVEWLFFRRRAHSRSSRAGSRTASGCASSSLSCPQTEEHPMFTSIATCSISGTLEAKLRAIAHAGFDGVEIFENDLLTSQKSAREIGAVLRDLGLKCTMFQPFRDFEGMPDTLRPRVFDRMERKFDLMEELGTDLLLVCSNVSPVASNDRSRIVADFRELGERAQ